MVEQITGKLGWIEKEKDIDWKMRIDSSISSFVSSAAIFSEQIIFFFISASIVGKYIICSLKNAADETNERI
jgi:hypothetical protein